ncbi:MULTISPECIES: histidine kinase [Curtobacterium]|uniref:sensor histidine kinase n=1 Tax=Curtobacterium flaccumfaciens TaxID=2035 RepID=UPI003EE72C6E
MARADARTDLVVAAGTAIVSVGLLSGLPSLDALDRLDESGSLGSSAAVASGTPPVGSAAWTNLLISLLVASALLLFARRWPRTTALGTAIVAAAAASTPSGAYSLVLLPVAVAVVLLGSREPLARTWPALVGTAALVTAGTAINDLVLSGGARSQPAEHLVTSLGAGVLQAVGAVGLSLLVALLIRSRRDVRAARTAEATAVDREQDARVEAAIGRERAAMARELHDIAAHHLSGIALMSAAIDRQIDTDPDRAHEGVRQVREQSTAVLEDLRRLVGLLREDGPAERAVETIAGIVDLVERSRVRMPVELEVLASDEHPLADGIGPLAQLAAYRAVQESLANAVLHAPGAPCTVTIDDRAAEQLVVRVANGAPTLPTAGGAAAGGNGLRGMRERADLVGARLQAGPQEGGGWLVELTLGREAPLASATEVQP